MKFFVLLSAGKVSNKTKAKKKVVIQLEKSSEEHGYTFVFVKGTRDLPERKPHMGL